MLVSNSPLTSYLAKEAGVNSRARLFQAAHITHEDSSYNINHDIGATLILVSFGR